MKLADNTDELKFWPDWTIDFGVTCPLVPKNPVFHLVRSIAWLLLIGSLWNLQVTWTGIKSQTGLNSSKIRLFTLELLALECQKNHIRLCPKCSLCNFYPVLNLQINRTNIKYTSSWTGIYFGITCLWLQARLVSGEWSLPIWETCLAHLSRRLTRWAYSIPMIRPSSSTLSNLNISEAI